MDNEIQLVGGPCGQHGPYTFYKAFRYTKNGIKRIVTLSEFFFVKLWIDSDLLCIGELQLLWSDKNSDQVLASLRLYFLPENTPEGRMDHGEDEVLAISEKVVLRVEDLITWITVDAEWTWGRLAKWEKDVKEVPPENEDSKCVIGSLTESSLDFSDVEKERKTSDFTVDSEGPLVVILSYPRYCRYRAMMRRLEGVEDEFLKYKIVTALGGFTVCTQNTRVLFCKDTFDYPELEGHELLCNHLAPKLKGRPRGKRKKRSISPGSESNESESSISNVFENSTKEKVSIDSRNGLHCDVTSTLRRSTRAIDNSENKEFLKELSAFMKANYTPIGKIPSLGYKELDLYSFYIKVQKIGGYDAVTSNRLWKSIFDEMSGHQNSTSAATVIRRHYERFLLPYERHIKGEEYKPLPVSERRRLKSKNGNSASDAETSESTSRSGNSTPIPQTPTTPTENKEFNIQVKSDNKTSSSSSSSSLRSVRVKTERQKDKQFSDKFNNTQNNNNINNINNNELSNESNAAVVIKSENQTSEETVEKIESKEKVEFITKLEKDIEPLTSAVAPIAQKLSDNKSLFPVEGKENIPIIKTGDTPTSNNQSPEIIEIPFKAKSPEVIEINKTTNLIEPYTNEVKKRKLDILKEGGLEVTPIRTFVPPSFTKDFRPSVIQQIGAQMMPKSLKNDVHHMPPPPISAHQSSKRLQVHIPQALNISQIPVKPTPSNQIIRTPTANNSNSNNNKYSYANGTIPPKVVQSRSIYSYSEKTVYGNPKDFSVVSPINPVHTPKSVGPPRQTGGDILDLTVSSPQKASIEIVKIPNYFNSQIPNLNSKQNPTKNLYNTNSHTSNSYNSKTSTPYNYLLDNRRLDSNIEITLVGSNSSSNKSINSQSHHVNKYNAPLTHHPSMPPASSASHHQNYHNMNRYSQKRPSTEDYLNQKMPRIEENHHRHKTMKPVGHSGIHGLSLPYRETKKGTDITIPHGYGSRNHSIKPDFNPPPIMPIPHNSKNTPFPGGAPPAPSPLPYLPQLYENNKNVPSYLPFLDPIYYLYSHNALNVTPPILPFPSPEHLKYYTELIARNSHLNFPFPNPPTDGNPAINNFKKQ